MLVEQLLLLVRSDPFETVEEPGGYTPNLAVDLIPMYGFDHLKVIFLEFLKLPDFFFTASKFGSQTICWLL